MKPINEMNLEELAEYAVTLDVWERVPGMVLSHNWGRVIAVDGQRFRTVDGWWERGNAYCYPDLTDPATLGCVLAMVRKKHGANAYTVYTERGWRVMSHEACESVESYIAIIQTVWGDEDTIALDEMDPDEMVIDPGTGEELGKWKDVAIKMTSPSSRTRCVVDASEEMPTEAHALIAALAKEVE